MIMGKRLLPCIYLAPCNIRRMSLFLSCFPMRLCALHALGRVQNEEFGLG